MTRGPTLRRRQLGRALRKAREDAGLTQTAVGRKLGCGQAKINKIETTLVTIGLDDLDKMIALYGIPTDKAAELKDLVSQDHRAGPRRTNTSPAWSAFEHLRDLEQDAREILCWHGERIPKPLQSEYYMLRQHRADNQATVDVVQLVRQLEARARVLTIPDPPVYKVILSEAALRRMPGGSPPELVVDQVEHLLKQTRHENLALQILTFNADIPFVDTDFQILRFSGDETDFAYIEAPGGARVFERPEELEMFLKHWEELRTSALSESESTLFLEILVKEAKAAWNAQKNGR